MIGLLSKRVRIEGEFKVQNDRGGHTFDYEDLGEYWAGIYPLSHSEITKYHEAGIETNVRIIVRYNPTTIDRLLNARVYHGLIRYDITSAIDGNLNQDYVELLGVTRR